MASSTPQPVKDIEFYEKLVVRDLELIMEQKREIGQLKAEVNKLRQKVESRRSMR